MSIRNALRNLFNREVERNGLRNLLHREVERGLNELGMKKADEKIVFIAAIVTASIFAGLSVIVLHIISTEASWYHYPLAATLGFLSAIALIYAIGFIVVDSQTILIVEEYGQYKRYMEPGWGTVFFPNTIEKIAKKINLRKEKVQMFESSGDHNQLDFSCGTSSPVRGEVWFIIKNPVLWTYRINDPGQWIQAQINAFMRPILERETLDGARLKKNVIATYCSVKEGTVIPRITVDEVTEDGYIIDADYMLTDGNGKVPLGFEIFQTDSDGNVIYDDADKKPGTEKKELVNFNQFALSQIGIEITSILILDIDIDEKVKEVRMKKFEGEAEAAKMQSESNGYILSLAEMRKTAADGGFTLSDEQIIDIFFRNRGLSVISKTDSNISIIGQEFGSMAAQLVKTAFENREGGSK